MALFMVFLAAPGALAQTLPPGEQNVPDPAIEALKAADPGLSEATIRDLVARLDDAEVRRLLLERLDAVTEQQVAAESEDLGGLLMQTRDRAEALRDGLARLIAAVPVLPTAMPAALDRLRDGRPAGILLWIAAGFALMMAVGWLAEWLARRTLRELFRQIAEAHPDAAAARFGRLALRLFLEFVLLGVFVAGALAVFFALTQGNEVTRTAVMTYVAAVVVVRSYAIFSRFLLAPRLPGLRLAHMSDHDARSIHRQNVIMASIAGFGFLTCSLLHSLGMPDDAHQVLTFSVGLVLIATLIYSLARARHAIAGDLNWEPERAAPFRAMLAQYWPLVTILYSAALYVIVVVIELTGGSVSYLASFGSLLAVIFLPHMDAILERAAQRLDRRSAQEETLFAQLRIVGLRASRFLLCIAVALFLARIWGVDLFSLAEKSFGGRLAGAMVDIGLTGLVAYVLWELARITIDRRLAEDAAQAAAEGQGEPEPGEQGGQGASRVRTLLPLMRLAIQITIVVMAVMLVLSALGVNIGPLLAGAGVVGLAVGFGAQTLVRDIVSGVFFLVDDAFRLGEYIDVGVVKGTVEKISLRSLRLRHHRGALHTVPFGEIQHLTNYSRDWAIMKLEFRVPFDTDLEKVRKIFKRIGQDLMKHEEIGPDFLQPFKSQGVLATDDSAFVVRGKFMAKPGRQFLIRRAVFQAVQEAFAREGIKFADRRVTVHVPGSEELDPEERAAAEKAAASAVTGAEAAANKA
ncbi:mechanosensitive ion channel family protein [Pelagibius sp.]|uniref:mechanosensitive ion channel family protein n=1 Tax=Pelagibius sp. TaxID=1931238 RepID=UPI0026395A56|nr:mechanosensitive ion channel domain-containing protein [Pelagibius sp.]